MIISGTDCPEKETVIKTLAASILCSAPTGKPCGTCRNCRKVLDGMHPDISVLSPADGKSEINVAQVRDLRLTVSVVPNDSENKVYIINSADSMNTAAQNVLLKTLEEPPRFAYFILSADSPGMLLPTVRSRCAELRFSCGDGPKIPDEAVEIADKFVKIYLTGDRFSVVKFINSLEKTDKNLMPYIAQAVNRLAVDRIKADVSVSEKRKLVKLIKTFDTVSIYLDMNVGVVHILGLIMSELV